jgi:hypothetical protein
VFSRQRLKLYHQRTQLVTLKYGIHLASEGVRRRIEVPFPSTLEELFALGDEFVREYWPGLAARGWNGYSEHGPGVVLVPWAAVEDRDQRRKAGGEGEEHYIDYSTGPTWAVVVDGYDPEQEIVVVFCEDQIQQGTGTLSGRYTWKRFAGEETPRSVAKWVRRVRPS